jgi:hypothetical protein
MTNHTQHIQRKIRQLAFLRAQYANTLFNECSVDQNKEYELIYNKWQNGYITSHNIQNEIDEYLKLIKATQN